MIWSRISRQDNNIFHINWKDQDKRKIFKNLQGQDNNYRNIVLSCSRAALIYIYISRSSRGLSHQWTKIPRNPQKRTRHRIDFSVESNQPNQFSPSKKKGTERERQRKQKRGVQPRRLSAWPTARKVEREGNPRRVLYTCIPSGESARRPRKLICAR